MNIDIQTITTGGEGLNEFYYWPNFIQSYGIGGGGGGGGIIICAKHYISLIIMHNSERDIMDLKTPVVHTLAYIESHIQQHGEEEAEVVEGVEAGRQS